MRDRRSWVPPRAFGYSRLNSTHTLTTMLSDIPVDVFLNILFLATPRASSYTQKGRQALIAVCLTCKAWKEIIYNSTMFWTSFVLEMDYIIEFNDRVALIDRWFRRAGERKLSLLVEDRKGSEVENDDIVDVLVMPSATTQFKPAYKLFLKYSGSWERIVFRNARLSWVHGLFIFLERRGALAACFREVKHLGLKFDGHYLPNVLPLNHMPHIQRLGVQGRGDCTSFRSAYAGKWSGLRELEMGMVASVSVHMQILRECVTSRS